MLTLEEKKESFRTLIKEWDNYNSILELATVCRRSSGWVVYAASSLRKKGFNLTKKQSAARAILTAEFIEELKKLL